MLRHAAIFINRSCHPAYGLETPKDGTLSPLPILSKNQGLLIGWRLGLELNSIRSGGSTILASHLAPVPLLSAFIRDLIDH